MTITTYRVIQVDNKFTCINVDDNNAQIVGGVFTSPTEAFYYSLKELDGNHEGPFVVEYLKKKNEEDDENGCEEN